MIYFSGTGNSKYIAELFCRNMSCNCYSIEERVDFEQLISSEEIIGFCYPIYGSRVPRIMREFSIQYMEAFKDKKIIIFCTQYIFSGDGARAFIDIFPKKYLNVIYAEHFFMPNNVCNLFILPLANDNKIQKYIKKSEQKIILICNNITSGIVKKRGFNVISKILGLFQGVFIYAIERKALNSVFINNDCIKCSLCVSICPMNNFEINNGKIAQKSNCTICYRCINKCPTKAISVFFNGKVKKQYKGINEIT
jgi:ferredoxin